MAGENAGASADGGAASDDIGAVINEISEPGPEPSPEEARARRLGWRPKEEFNGRGSWLPADKYVEKIETEAPVLRERLRFQDDVIAKQQTRIDSLDTRTKEMADLLRDMHGRTMSAEQRGFNRAREELEARMRQAVKEADEPAYDRAKADLEQLDKMRPAAPKTNGPQPNGQANGQAGIAPETQAWIRDNPWFEADDVMKAVAVTYNAKLFKEQPGLPLKDQLEKVREEVERRFPEKFANSQRAQATTVSQPSAQAPRKPTGPKKRTAADLPEEHRKIMDRFIKLIPGYKADDYLRDYKWDE